LVTAVVVDLIVWVLVAVLVVSAVGGLGLDATHKPLVFMFVGVVTFLLYLVHWGVVCGSSIAAQLGAESVDSMDSLATYVAHLRVTQPTIVVSVHCYVTQSYSTTDANGTTTSSSENVTTHLADQTFQYDDVVDASAPFVIPPQAHAIRLDVTARSVFGDAHTAELFEAEYSALIAANTQDTVSHYYRCIVPGLVPTRLVVLRGRQSSAMHPVWYYLASFFCLDGLFGLFFASAATELDYVIVKSVQRRA
jgi:hypothetical protein